MKVINIEDIKHAAILAKLSGKNFSNVLAMKVDWNDVAKKLGVSHEQVKAFLKQEHDSNFAKKAGIALKTFQALKKEGYSPRDIDIAGRIAKEANKDIREVLKKRTINNTWDEVAKSFGVELKHFKHKSPKSRKPKRN